MIVYVRSGSPNFAIPRPFLTFWLGGVAEAAASSPRRAPAGGREDQWRRQGRARLFGDVRYILLYGMYGESFFSLLYMYLPSCQYLWS
jgi:hypothetical protein